MGNSPAVPEKIQISCESNLDFPQAVVEFVKFTFHYCKSFAYELQLVAVFLKKSY